MTIDVSVLERKVDPQKTVLIFGAGSSIPSGAPSTPALIHELTEKFGINDGTSLSLSDLSTVIEAKASRRELVEYVSARMDTLNPARGLLTLPEFDWAGIYTTNYDELVEKSFARLSKPLRVYASNFDFTTEGEQSDTHYYKLHGTINADESLGHRHRMILSGRDYDLTSEYRENLFAKLAEQLMSKNAIVIGQSLADPDLKAVVDSALRAKSLKGAPGAITLLSYEKDENQAIVFEARGLEVCFAGIDEFFEEMGKKLEDIALLPGITDNPLDRARSVHPATTNVADAKATQTGAVYRMFSGGAANYADIARGWTFDREFSEQLESQLLAIDSPRIAYVLGSAGTGKTTGVRQALCRLADRGVHCWEHEQDFELQAPAWIAIDSELRKRSEQGILFVDDAHHHLHKVNAVVEAICQNEKPALRIVLVSSKPNWNPRLKSAAIFSDGEQYEISKLTASEIDRLLDLLEGDNDFARLVEQTFLGFSRAERQRRLADRCQADMFVCLKNIFASEAFDDIILREFAELNDDYQELYRRISGMEAAGIRVHRQFVLRTVHIQPNQIERVLSDLEGLIEERTISDRHGIYTWSVRHGIIAEIVSKYKISDGEDFYNLLETAVDNLNPTYEIELKSMDEICSPRGGFGRVPNKNKQNILLRKMISLAPRRRVPRHRLITNLIALQEYENAQSEIRLFENELRLDSPVHRYKIKLRIERARHSQGIMDEDRAAIIQEAAALAEAGIEKFPHDKNMYDIYLQAGVAYYRYTAEREMFESAIQAAQNAYQRILDPVLQRTISHYERIAQRF